MTMIAPSPPSSALERVIRPADGTLPRNLAEYLISLGFSDQDKARCEVLSAAAQDGSLSAAERDELDDLLSANDVLMLLKSKARASLRTVRDVGRGE